MTDPIIICVTPVRDEAWILDRFIQTTLTWADELIILDQGSTDGSREIVRSHPNVRLLENDDLTYDEHARKDVLIREARTLPSPRLIVALDADEVLCSAISLERLRASLRGLPPGTRAGFRWLHLMPNLKTGWWGGSKVFCFADDGQPIVDSPSIHGERIPIAEHTPETEIDGLIVLHYQSADPARMRSKHRWYQCVERLQFEDKRPSEIFRIYHQNDAAIQEVVNVPATLFASYEALGIDMGTITRPAGYWWDVEVVELLREHGTERFRRVDMWDDVNWNEMSARLGGLGIGLEDPRTWLDRLALRWLRFAQPRRRYAAVRATSRLLRVVGW